MENAVVSAAVIAARAEATPGIAAARVPLLAGPRWFRARVRVLLDPGNQSAHPLARLSAGALDEARRSLAPLSVDLYGAWASGPRRERRAW
ncbi:hypothetical protein [Streptomyces sp. NPDC000229]|uniref:hypothetical protein n=1 Tax=Streptomyces sp. NPDC000229 TaxID=3154247 RepID=UPI00332936C3